MQIYLQLEEVASYISRSQGKQSHLLMVWVVRGAIKILKSFKSHMRNDVASCRSIQRYNGITTTSLALLRHVNHVDGKEFKISLDSGDKSLDN